MEEVVQDEEVVEIVEEVVVAIKIWCHFQLNFATTQPVHHKKSVLQCTCILNFHKTVLCICVRWHMFNILNH